MSEVAFRGGVDLNIITLANGVSLSMNEAYRTGLGGDLIPGFEYNQYGSLRLYEGGCLVNTGPAASNMQKSDCTEACKLHPFQDIPTVANCMVYPVISNLLKVGNITDEGKRQAKLYGVRSATDFNSSGIIEGLRNCFDAICETKPCRTYCPAQNTPHDNWTNVPEENSGFTSPYSCYKDICYDLDDEVDQDIGGIGTSISFLMQIVILIISYLALRSFDNWVYNTLFVIFWCGGSFYPRQKARYFQERLRGSQQHAALQTAFLEFQKAQSYVLIAFQIAAILALVTRSKAKLIDSTNMSQLQSNLNQLKYIGRDGLLTVMFGLLCLHVERLTSWFLLLLSTITVALSMTVLHLVEDISVDANNVDAGEASARCIGGINPLAFCYKSNSYSGSQEATRRHNMGQSIVLGDSVSQTGLFHINYTALEPYAYVGLVLFFLDQWKFNRTIGGTTEEANLYRHILRYVLRWKKPPPLARRCIRIFASFAVTCTGIGFVILLLFFFVEILLQLRPENTRWTFGQVLSVAVWVPSLVEFVYLSCYGMVRGMKYRVPQPYQVIRRRTTNLRQD